MFTTLDIINEPPRSKSNVSLYDDLFDFSVAYNSDDEDEPIREYPKPKPIRRKIYDVNYSKAPDAIFLPQHFGSANQLIVSKPKPKNSLPSIKNKKSATTRQSKSSWSSSQRKHRSSSTLPPLRLKTVEKEVMTMKDGVATIEKKKIQYVVEDEEETSNPLQLRLYLRETTMPCFSSKQRINKLYENELKINRDYKHITDTHEKWDNVYKMIDHYQKNRDKEWNPTGSADNPAPKIIGNAELYNKQHTDTKTFLNKKRPPLRKYRESKELFRTIPYELFAERAIFLGGKYRIISVYGYGIIGLVFNMTEYYRRFDVIIYTPETSEREVIPLSLPKVYPLFEGQGSCVVPGQKKLMCEKLIDLVDCYKDQNENTVFTITPGDKDRNTLADIHRESLIQEQLSHLKLNLGKDRIMKEIYIISDYRLIVTITDIRSYTNNFRVTAYYPRTSTELVLVLDYKEIIRFFHVTVSPIDWNMEYKQGIARKILESLTCVVENNEIFLECKGRKGLVCTAFFNEKPPDPPGVEFKKKFVDNSGYTEPFTCPNGPPGSYSDNFIKKSRPYRKLCDDQIFQGNVSFKSKQDVFIIGSSYLRKDNGMVFRYYFVNNSQDYEINIPPLEFNQFLRKSEGAPDKSDYSAVIQYIWNKRVSCVYSEKLNKYDITFDWSFYNQNISIQSYINAEETERLVHFIIYYRNKHLIMRADDPVSHIDIPIKMGKGIMEQIEQDLNKSKSDEFKTLIDEIIIGLSLEMDENGKVSIV